MQVNDTIFFSQQARNGIGSGEVREWLNRAVSKTVVPARVPWVRIPPSPPLSRESQVWSREPERVFGSRWCQAIRYVGLLTGSNIDRERCRSGLTGSTGNAVYGKPYRGFESHPLRQRTH